MAATPGTAWHHRARGVPARPRAAAAVPARTHRPPGRLPSLTGIRGFGALLVFVGHLDLIGGFSPFTGIDRALAPAVSMISLFFVLSGFVLAWSYRRSMSGRAFLRRRAARLLPLYLAALAVAALVDIRLHTGLIGAQGWPSALLVQSWIPHQGYAYAVNGPGWSLSDELFFYLLFPLLLPLLLRLPTRLRLPLVALLAGLEVGDAVVTAHMAGYGAVYWNYLFPPLRLCEFVAGAVLSLHVRDGWRPPVGARVAGLIFLAAYAVTGFLDHTWQAAAVTFLPICLVVSALAADDVDGRPGRLLARPLVVRLGDWSYAFYLVHQIVILVLSRVGAHSSLAGSPLRGLVLSALALAVALVAAKVLHERLEVPLERRWGGSREAAHGAPAAVSSIDITDPAPVTAAVDGAADAARPVG